VADWLPSKKIALSINFFEERTPPPSETGECNHFGRELPLLTEVKMNIFGFVIPYWIVGIVFWVGVLLWLFHWGIVYWIQKKIFRIRAPKIFENHFGYKPEKDSQLRDLQLIKVVMPMLNGAALDLQNSYVKESQLLTKISQAAVYNNFEDARNELLSARGDKEYHEKRFYDAKRVATLLEYNVPDEYKDYLR